MITLDDDTLSALLARAGESFVVPGQGAAKLMDQAFSDRLAGVGSEGAQSTDGTEGDPGDGAPDELGRVGRGGRVVGLARRHRMLAVAACVVLGVLAAGTVGALVDGPSRTTDQVAEGPAASTAAPRAATSHGGESAPGSSGPASGRDPGGATRAFGPASGVVTPTTTPTAPSLPTGSVDQNAKIEQTGSLGISVGRGRLGGTVDRLGALATADGGFVVNSQTQSGGGTGGAPYGTVTLDIPVGNFQTALKQATLLGRTTSESTKASDVTGQYVDLQARIAALEASRQQYLTILSKATTVGDVLAVQAQLDTIQSQIEQLQGQLQVLSSETSDSTLSVTVSEGAPVSNPGPLPESGIVHAWHESIGGFVAGIEGLVRIAGPVLFALLCAAAGVIGGRALWRRYRRHSL